MLMLKSGLAIVLLVVPSFAGAQTVDPSSPLLSLESSNPDIAAAEAEAAAARAELWAARGAWLPQVRVEAQAGMLEETLTIDGVGELPTVDRDPASVALTLEQNLFTSGRLGGRVGSAKATADAAASDRDAVRQDVFFAGAVAIADVVRDREIVKERRLNEQTAIERRVESRRRREAGRATVTDLAQSEAREALARADRVAAEGALRRSEAAFMRVFGFSVPADLRLPAPPPHGFSGLDQAIDAALRVNPSLEASRLRSRAAKQSVREARGAVLPQVTVAAESIYAEEERFGPDLGEVEQQAVYLRGRWDFFSGGSGYAQASAAKRRSRAAQNQQLSVERAIREQTITSWSDLATSRSVLLARQSQATAARIAREGVAREFEVGRRTRLDLLDADRELSDAEVAVLIAERDVVVAQYALLTATGQLIDVQ